MAEPSQQQQQQPPIPLAGGKLDTSPPRPSADPDMSDAYAPGAPPSLLLTKLAANGTLTPAKVYSCWLRMFPACPRTVSRKEGEAFAEALVAECSLFPAAAWRVAKCGGLKSLDQGSHFCCGLYVGRFAELTRVQRFSASLMCCWPSASTFPLARSCRCRSPLRMRVRIVPDSTRDTHTGTTIQTHLTARQMRRSSARLRFQTSRRSTSMTHARTRALTSVFYRRTCACRSGSLFVLVCCPSGVSCVGV